MSGAPGMAMTALERVVHRELLALLLLAAVGVTLFLLTRQLAASNAALRRADAVTWHAQGRRALAQGDTPHALTALRHASHLDPGSRDISVTLAAAFRAAGQHEEAAAVLEALRKTHPDDADVNLGLARLESERHALPAAVRAYQTALDALWAPGDAELSRNVRLEFIALLQQHGDRARALSQALVYAAELPPDAASQLRAAHLLFEVGAPRRALQRFTLVLTTQPQNAGALAGAGEAAFALGDYEAARRYLSQLPARNDHLTSLQRVSALVLSVDPLAPRVPGRERERRLQELLRHARTRLLTCGGNASLLKDLDALQRPGHAARVRAAADGGAANRLEDGVTLASHVVQVSASCRPVDDFGRAVTIIARRHSLEESR